MTVKELIEKLQKYDPELMVFTNDYDTADGGTPVHNTRKIDNSHWYGVTHQFITHEDTKRNASFIILE